MNEKDITGKLTRLIKAMEDGVENCVRVPGVLFYSLESHQEPYHAYIALDVT